MLSKFSFFHSFLNLMSFSSHLVFGTRVNGVVFWPHLGTVKCKISRCSGGFAPWTPNRVLPWTRWGLQHPRPLVINTTKNSPLIAQRLQNSLCANLQLAKCVWAIHQIRALFESPRYSPDNFCLFTRKYLEEHRCVTEGCKRLWSFKCAMLKTLNSNFLECEDHR